MKQPICITFAWVPGSGKTPITNFLSTKIDFPIFNNDAIRSEVIENYGFLDEKVHLKIRNERLLEIMEQWKSFILDASIDRVWFEKKNLMKKFNYKVFIISLDLGENLIKKWYKNKNYTSFLEDFDTLFTDHKKFLEHFSDEVNLHITDLEYKNRLKLSFEAVNEFLKNN